MKHGRETNNVTDGADNPPTPKAGEAQAKGKRRRGWRWVVFVFLLLAALLGIGRAIMPWAVRDYVNRTLDLSPQHLSLYGLIQEVRISKTTGNVPVPFFSAKRVDFAMQWPALLHGRLVGRVLMEQPEMNFVDAPGEGEVQTGAGGPWLQMIRDLFPFKINGALVKDGSVHFRAFQAQKPVDVYLSQVEGAIDNLSNIRDETNPLVSTVQATALVMDQAKVDFKMTLDPFSYRLTFHMGVRLLGLDATKINDLALTYGKFDFKRGWFDLVGMTASMRRSCCSRRRRPY